jgi:hypothetical protein
VRKSNVVDDNPNSAENQISFEISNDQAKIKTKNIINLINIKCIFIWTIILMIIIIIVAAV